MEKTSNEYYTIDLVQIAMALWKRIWVIGISGFLAAVIGFVISAVLIAPTYSSSILLYVNNSSFSLGNTNFSISSSEITAAQSLVKTYSEILLNRTTMEWIIEETGVDYSSKELLKMNPASPSNGTEIMRVTVVSEDPYEAAEIANCIAEVLPKRIKEIIDGASMEVVDSAIPNLDKIAPSITKYTAIALFLGLLISVGVLALLAILDDTIHDEDYVLQTYKYPILAKIPSLMSGGSGSYGYTYKRRGKSHNGRKEGEK